MALLFDAADESAAHRLLDDLSCTDGLPVVVPTPERVERMALASGLDGDIVLGTVPPRGGAATVQAVAANAVMAGCTPDDFAVVIAAVAAVLDPQFDLAEVQATTNPVSPMIIVNGPVRRWCGIASAHGALGPGHRANATIGRAVRLVLINVGGALPGEGDMALLGHGSKFSACLAEDEDASPFVPLHVARGFQREQSTVTVVGADAPQAVVFERIPDARLGAELFVDLLAALMASPAHVGTYSGDGCDVIILNPNHARLVRDAGFDRAALADAVCERSGTEVGRLRRRNPAVYDAVAGAHKSWPDDAIVPAAQADRLIIAVAGGFGAYSWVMRSWGVGPHRGTAVSRVVDLDQSCDIGQ